MIRDARVLRAGFVPREVEHRDAEVNHLSSVLEPITNGEPADTAIVTGPSGAGKTCISQFVTERLREEVLDVEATYVNCWRKYTRFRTLYQILDDLGATIDIHRQSTPHNELVDRLQQHDGPRTVVILDEVDQLEDPSVIYDLHSLPQFAIICIANKEEEPELEGRSGALKWILVACFGYQGFSNAKFGRIECHEAINAFAREILLTAKQRLEAGGWRVVHGIVDSIWVTPDPDVNDDDHEDLEKLATEITEDVEIRLEHEAHYNWVAFVPQRESDAGALTKYFGKVAGADEFKVRGIEARQQSTPPFIEKVQRDCLEQFDATRSPDAVIDSLQDALTRLHAGTVPIENLVERNRVSKPLEGYTQNTQNVAALKRACDQDLAVHPGQDIEYVVVDDEKTSRERVALAHEEVESYDSSYYETQLVRAMESVLSPLGWDRTDIQQELSGAHVPEIIDFQ